MSSDPGEVFSACLYHAKAVHVIYEYFLVSSMLDRSGGLVSYLPSHLSPAEYELGVTNRWCYGADKPRKSENERNAVEGTKKAQNHNGDSDLDVSVRPEKEGTSFSQTESGSSDLLF